ncbi:hypothetical protein ACH5RR_010399 [Cinchona calisaya]|uniref:Uncharacterized protein n=1 Tax=Cinchona calisaya TaxID=153742 RepID=A0ABD3AIT8_9GENT
MASVGHQYTHNGRLNHHHHHKNNPIHHHHHHHHFYLSPNCPLHGYMMTLYSKTHHHHSPTCPSFASSHLQPRNPETIASVPIPFPNPFNLQPIEPKESDFNNINTTPGVMNKEYEELEEEEQQHMEEEDEEEEEDPVFVLTDEWREFFAKSEAKRRLAKKQAKINKRKNQQSRQPRQD